MTSQLILYIVTKRYFMSNFDIGNSKVKSSRFHLTGLNFNQKESDKLISKLDTIYKLNLLDIKSRTI